MGMSIKEPKNLLPGPHFKGTVGVEGWKGGGVHHRADRARVCVCVYRCMCALGGVCLFSVMSLFSVTSPHIMQKSHGCLREKPTPHLCIFNKFSASDLPPPKKNLTLKVEVFSTQPQKKKSLHCIWLEPVLNSHRSLNNAFVTEACCSAPCSHDL